MQPRIPLLLVADGSCQGERNRRINATLPVLCAAPALGSGALGWRQCFRLSSGKQRVFIDVLASQLGTLLNDGKIPYKI